MWVVGKSWISVLFTAKRFLREKEHTMGDKGGKKDKDKGQKQKVSKKEQDQKKKQDKRPKRP
jgi:hypothetical protein